MDFLHQDLVGCGLLLMHRLVVTRALSVQPLITTCITEFTWLRQPICHPTTSNSLSVGTSVYLLITAPDCSSLTMASNVFSNVHPHFNPEEAAHTAVEFVSSAFGASAGKCGD